MNLPDNPYKPPSARVEDAAVDAAPVTQRPAAVSIALWLLWMAMAIEVLNTAAGVREALPAGGVVVVATTFTLVMVGLVCGLIFMIGRRRNWARITYAVLFSLGMIVQFIIWQETLASPRREVLAIVLQSGLQFAAMILLFQRVSNAWFRTKRVKTGVPAA